MLGRPKQPDGPPSTFQIGNCKQTHFKFGLMNVFEGI
jgi:hypothetical protein